MSLRKITLITALMAVGALVLAACGSDPTATPRPPADPTATPTTAPPTATPTPPPPGTTPPPPKPTATATATPAPPPPTATPARDLEAYFDGRTIVVNVGFSPGGGYDSFARLFSRFAENHFPGSPRFVVRNIPGAGGQRAIVETMVNGKPDGFTVVVIHPRFFKRELLGIDVPEFDIDTTTIIGTPSATSATSALFCMRSYATSWAEIEAKSSPAKDGATAVGDGGGVGTAFLNLLGANVDTVYGYGGTSEIAAAFARGELDCSSRGGEVTAASLFPEWIEQRLIVPVVWWGADPSTDESFVKYVTETLGAEIPPHVFDLVDATDGQKNVFNLTLTVNEVLSRVFALPPDVPEDITVAWRSAFAATVADPDFVQAALLLDREVKYGSPESIRSGLDAGFAAINSDPALREFFTAMAGGDG